MSTYDRVIREVCRRLNPLTRRFGFALSPIHFYYPIPDLDDLRRRGVWNRKSEMPGIHWDLSAQLQWLHVNLKPYSQECQWPEKPDPVFGTYGTQASTFGFTSAMLAHAMVRHFKPKRIVEVGCGWSTTILVGAARQNQDDGASRADYLGIDPYPPAFLDRFNDEIKVMRSAVQDVSIDEFTALQAGDILFIDSSHVLNIGSDVQSLYLEILPRLSSGVVVHVHDIQLPYEYPPDYAQRLGWFWNEQYILQAFLSGNTEWEILAAGFALCREKSKELEEIFPPYSPSKHGETGSFWMRKQA